MKNHATAITTLLMLSLCSCSRIIYTNKQFMNGLKTKEGIVNKLGLPNEKRTAGDVEEWLYKYEDLDTLTGRPVTHVPVASTVGVVNFTLYKRYVLLRMDAHGSVLSWSCAGVSFTKRKAAPGATIALITSGIGLVCFLIYVSNNALPDNF